MTRRDRRAGTDRWLVSYADLVTLLLAFFASAYAVSDLNAAKVKPAALAIRQALGRADAPPSEETVSPTGTPEGFPRQALSNRLRAVLAAEIASGRARVATSRNDLVLSLPEAATFESGRAELNADARRVLARLADVLIQTELDTRVEGHTDDVPITSPRYSSNWELSTARASGVVAVLVAQGVAPVRLSAAGYGEFHPKVPNVTPENRAQNRRVDIVLVDGALVDAGSVRP